jgi:hypothetical protein
VSVAKVIRSITDNNEPPLDPAINQPYVVLSLVAVKRYLPALNGPLTAAVSVSDANVILSIEDNNVGVFPPPYQPYVRVPVPAKLYLVALNGPRVVGVAVSVAKVIRATVEVRAYGGPLNPPPYHPAVACDGGGTRVKPPPAIVNPPVIVILILFKPLYYAMPEFAVK